MAIGLQRSKLVLFLSSIQQGANKQVVQKSYGFDSGRKRLASQGSYQRSRRFIMLKDSKRYIHKSFYSVIKRILVSETPVMPEEIFAIEICSCGFEDNPLTLSHYPQLIQVF
jgi:hypothetical protein